MLVTSNVVLAAGGVWLKVHHRLLACADASCTELTVHDRPMLCFLHMQV